MASVITDELIFAPEVKAGLPKVSIRSASDEIRTGRLIGPLIDLMTIAPVEVPAGATLSD